MRTMRQLYSDGLFFKNCMSCQQSFYEKNGTTPVTVSQPFCSDLTSRISWIKSKTTTGNLPGILWGTASIERMPSSKSLNLVCWKYFSRDSSNDSYKFFYVHCISEAELLIPTTRHYACHRSKTRSAAGMEACIVWSVCSSSGLPLHMPPEKKRVRDNRQTHMLSRSPTRPSSVPTP
jgi:hypothetical protein